MNDKLRTQTKHRQKKRPLANPSSKKAVKNYVMNDILAQLHRQRQKRCSACNTEFETTAVVAPRNASPSVKANSVRVTTQLKTFNVRNDCSLGSNFPKTVGNFTYDPILRRYFPTSTFQPNGNNDVCVQNIQRTNVALVNSWKKNGDDGTNSIKSNFLSSINTRELQLIVFHGTVWKKNAECPFLQPLHSYDFESESSLLAARKEKKGKKKGKNGNFISSIHNNSIGDARSNRNFTSPNLNQSTEDLKEFFNMFFPCSEKSVLLLSISLPYCTNAHRRKTIVSTLGPICIARRAKVVATVATKEILLKKREVKCSVRSNESTSSSKSMGLVHSREWCSDSSQVSNWLIQKKNSFQSEKYGENLTTSTGSIVAPIWYSMLYPIVSSEKLFDLPAHSTTSIPYDCHCKTYLHPAAPTFDILPFTDDRVTTGAHLPHIVTIINEGLYYRSPTYIPANGRKAHHLGSKSMTASPSAHFRQSNSDMGWKLVPSGSPIPGKIHGVRFAPSNMGWDQDIFIGSTTFDSREDQAYFTFQSISSCMHQSYVMPFGGINDFCFSKDNLIGNPGIVAFAHNGKKMGGACFLDLTTNKIFGVRKNWIDSDILCVKFLESKSHDKVLFGHRDGSVSIIDNRSKDSTVVSMPKVSFGSVASMQPLKNNVAIAVKGSFGPCGIIDMRCIHTNKKQSSEKINSLILELPIQSYIVDQTRSARCTGLAIDPSETIILAPFASRNKGAMVALWSINTGALLRTICLNISSTESTSCSVNNSETAAFCELSSSSTVGFDMTYNEQCDLPILTCDKRVWGAWYKSASVVSLSPSDGGGIHHLSL